MSFVFWKSLNGHIAECLGRILTVIRLKKKKKKVRTDGVSKYSCEWQSSGSKP